MVMKIVMTDQMSMDVVSGSNSIAIFISILHCSHITVLPRYSAACYTTVCDITQSSTASHPLHWSTLIKSVEIQLKLAADMHIVTRFNKI